MRKTLLLCLLSSIWACSNSPTSVDDLPDEPSSIQEEFETLVPTLMSDNTVPGVGVGVIIDGEVVMSQGFGFADVETDKAVTSRTTFSAGEISTIGTGWGVVNLVAERRMAIEGPIEAYLGGWKLPPSDFDHSEVTLEALLRHQGGTNLPDYPGFPPGAVLPTIHESLSGDTNGAGDVRVVFEPGTETRYSSGGMTVIQLAIDETVVDHFLSYRTLVEESVLRPLGVVSSKFLVTPTISMTLATAYGEDGTAIGHRRFVAHAASGLLTTVADMVTFAEAFMSIYDGGSYPVSGFTRSNLLKVLRVAEGPEPEYEFGHQVRQLGEVTLIGQVGGHDGWHANLQIDVEGQNAIIVLTNSSNGEAVHSALVCRWIDEIADVTSSEFCQAGSN